MITNLAVVDGGEAVAFGDASGLDGGVDDPVIAAVEPTGDVAFHIG